MQILYILAVVSLTGLVVASLAITHHIRRSSRIPVSKAQKSAVASKSAS